jgi:hypothetical protein
MDIVALQFDLYTIFDNTFFYLTFIVSCFALIGLFSKSFIYSAYAGLIGFASLSTQTEYQFFQTLLLVVGTLMLIMMSFSVVNMFKTGGKTDI